MELRCSVEGCTNQGKLNKRGVRFYPRGFCNTHYENFCKNNRELLDKKREDSKNRVCIVEGCYDNRNLKLGYCNKHYMRFKKYGDPEYVTKIRVGQESHPLYNLYRSMKRRCYEESCKDYGNYGGRGIRICERWLGMYGFLNFVSDMGERPENFSLDRIDNSKDYSPENCRWASVHTQGLNKRTSKYKGVTFNKSTGKWRVRITKDKIQYEIGQFKDFEEAMEARKHAELELLGYIIDIDR